MHTTITKAQLVKFVLNDVNKEERKKISEAITINLEIKQRYLYEKRKHDVERYIYDEMRFGECCEIELLIKKDSRLNDHFVLNSKPNVADEQDVSINGKHIPITKEQLVNIVLNDINDKEYKKISKAINTDSLTKERYLNVKRRYDVDRYIDNKMDFGERCEIEDILRVNIRLYDYFELRKNAYEEKLNVSVNGKHFSITKLQLIKFVLNDVSEEEHKKISEAINTNPEIKKKYLYEKRICDIERYINNKMDLGERCEIEELIKTDSRLYTNFKVNNGVFKDEQDVTIKTPITY